MEEQEEKPGFIQSCSLEDGCSMRFYGDECQNSFGHRFSSKSQKQSFYDGYGGDCSFKAEKNKWIVCFHTALISFEEFARLFHSHFSWLLCVLFCREFYQRPCLSRER